MSRAAIFALNFATHLAMAVAGIMQTETAFAACVEAASIGRKALSDQNPIKNRARRQG